MTSLPAEILRLKDRGVLRDGAAGDIVVLDPSSFSDRTTYQNPDQSPAGVVATLVNGEVVFQAGTNTGSRNGAILKPLL